MNKWYRWQGQVIAHKNRMTNKLCILVTTMTSAYLRAESFARVRSRHTNDAVFVLRHLVCHSFSKLFFLHFNSMLEALIYIANGLNTQEAF